MQLDAMTLAEIKELHLNIDVLIKVGQVLAECDLRPIFGLVPGAAATIVLPAIMPPVHSMKALAAAPLSSSLRDARGVGAADAPPAVDMHATAGAEAPPSATEAPTSSRAPSGPVSAAATGAEPALPPAVLFDPAPGHRPWTPPEDAQLVSEVARLYRSGLSRSAASRQVAHALGRSAHGAKYRLYHELKSAFAAALAAPAPADPPIAVAEQHPPRVRDGSPVGGGADIGSTADAPADTLSPVPYRRLEGVREGNALADHVAGLPRAAPWSLARDEELMSLANSGWGIPEIATEMQLGGDVIRKRFDQMTGLCRDENGKPARRFKSHDVAEFLTQLKARPG